MLTYLEMEKSMCKFKSIGIKERTDLIYELGLENDYTNTRVHYREKTGESYAVYMCKKVIEFYTTNNRYPSAVSKNEFEKTMGVWLNSMRKAKKGKGKHIFYISLISITTECGLCDMFDINYESNSITKCNKTIQFVKLYGKYPVKRSKNYDERILGTWLCNMRKAKKGTAIHNVFRPILNQMAIDSKYPNMFNANWRDDLRK